MELDNDPQILDFRFADGNSMWLSIRFDLKMINYAAQANDAVAASQSKALSKTKLLQYMWHTFRKNPMRSKRNVDVWSVANYEENDEIPNWWTAFLQQIPECSRVELLYSHRCYAFGNIANTYSLDYFFYKSILLRKWAKIKGIKEDNLTVQKFISFLRNKFQHYLTESDFNRLQNQLVFVNGMSSFYRKQLKKYIQYLQPKLIVCSEGNNGDWRYGILFSVAGEMQIPTVEVQHGTLGLGMKFGEALIYRPEFRAQKSKYLFTFGPFHNSKSNATEKNISFGHYHLEKIYAKYKKTERREGPLRVLFVCEGIPATALNNGFVTCVGKALQQLEIPFELIIRLHPTENPDTKYEPLISTGKSRYSDYRQDDIYALLADTDITLGHISTVLFEALYFDKAPFIYRDAQSDSTIPMNLGVNFSTPEELLLLIENFQNGKISLPDKKEFWAEKSTAENFREFWETNVVGL